MRSRDPNGDMYIRAHTQGGKCHYCVLAKSRGTCSRNAKSLLPFSIDSIIRRSGNLMRLISVSVDGGGQQRENTFTITLVGIKPGLIESTFSTFNLRKAMVYRFGLFNNSCQAREYKLSFAGREEAIGSPVLARKKIRHNPTFLDWNQPSARGIDCRFSEGRPRNLILQSYSFFPASCTRSPLPESNKYSISFLARSVAPCRCHCL